jgi:type II secretory pathway pseudopilin PulG
MRTRERKGFLLVATLVALIIISLLITGAFVAGGEDFAVSRAELRDQQTFAYAELAGARALSAWSATDRDQMPIASTAVAAVINDSPLDGTVYVTRLDSALYSVVAEARLTSPNGSGVKRRVGMVVTTVRNGARNPPVRIPQQAWSELY